MMTTHPAIKSSLFALSLASMSLGLLPVAQADQATANGWAVEAGHLLESNMSYPRIAQYRGETGTAYIQVTVDASGDIKSYDLMRSSGWKRLDDASLETIDAIGHFPATGFTSDSRTTFTVGLNYVIEDGMGQVPAYQEPRSGHVRTHDVAKASDNMTFATIEFSTEAEG